MKLRSEGTGRAAAWLALFNRAMLTVAALLFSAGATFSATITAKTGSGSWNTGSTWVGNVVPQANDDVIIPLNAVVTVNHENLSSHEYVEVSGELKLHGGTYSAYNMGKALLLQGNLKLLIKAGGKVEVAIDGMEIMGGNDMIIGIKTGKSMVFSIQSGGSLTGGLQGYGLGFFNSDTKAIEEYDLANFIWPSGSSNSPRFPITSSLQFNGVANGTGISMNTNGVAAPTPQQAANTPPTATNLTQSKTATEGGSSVALDDIVVSDPDNGETITATMTLSSAAGTLSTGTYGSATSTFNAGTGVWTVSGSVANVNAALAAVAFAPSANNDQNFTITTRIRDAAATGPADGTISFTVTGVNDAPTATNLTQSKVATEGGSSVALDDIVVSDPDNGETITARMSLSSAAAGTLSTGTYGTATSTFNAATGVWTVSGSVANVNAALAAVAFTPSANNDQNFSITTRIRDAAASGPADGTISFTVTAVNDVPTATNLTQSKTATEGGSSVALDDIVVSDPDNGETITATMTLSSSVAGTLSTGAYGSATSTFNAATGVWTVSGSVANVNAALAAVGLTPSANNDQSFTITTRIRDAAASGPADGTISFTVTAVNDVPTATNLTQSKTATEGGSSVALDDIVVSDPDNGETITATMTLGTSTAGTLSTGTYGSATSTFSAATGVWTVSGSVANVNAALAAVAFTPSANNDQNFSITTRIRDAAATGPADGTISFSITAVNDAPTATNLTQSKTATEGGSSVTLDDIVVSDPDNGETITATLTVGSAAAGTLSTGTYGSATSTFNAGTGVWTVSGSVANVNAALAAVAFTPSANNDQNFSITTRIRDAAGTGPADGTISFTVTGVNDAPTANNDNISVNENSGARVVDVLANDSTAPDTGETLTVTAVTQPANGTVTLTAGVVRFTPAANFNGSTTFTYTISDGNGGTASAMVTVTVVPNVLPVELVSFRASAVGRTARLEWTTANETNNSYFEILRSTDGIAYVKVGTVPTKGSNSKYELKDELPFNGKNYYRLIQFDGNGRSKELGHQVLDFNLTDGIGLTVYPNPVVADVNVAFAQGAKQLILVDISGRVLQVSDLKPTDTGHTFKLGNLPSGTYFIKLATDKGMMVKKLLKK